MADPKLEEIERELFERVMQGRWEEVIRIYKDDKRAHQAKVTVSEGTALHVAVLEGKEAEVKELVDQIGEDLNALMIKNKMGDTPLHLAASIGNVSMCECIAKGNAELVGACNKKNETPLFLAALHGKIDAFLRLLEICEDQALGYHRRDDGDTILHCAITGEYFDLAFTIIHVFPRLVNSVNERGLSPLHLLANKPTAFRSGTHLSWIDNIFYHSIFVPELKFHKGMHGDKKNSNTRSTTEGPAENAPKFSELADVENPKEGRASPQHQGHQSNIGADGKQPYPPNSGKGLMLAILLSILGSVMTATLKYGSNKMKRIIRKKRKNTWSFQIMKELLYRTEISYKYYDTGRSPYRTPYQKEDETSPLTARNEERKPSSVDESSSRHQSTLQEEGKTTPSNAPTESSSPKDGSVTEIETASNDKATKSHTKANQTLENDKRKGKKTEETEKVDKKLTPILLSAKNGITEMVEEILERFPVAIQDMNSENKNIVLLAVENRQTHVYELLVKREIQKETVFRVVDQNKNSALHLAAMSRDDLPWHTPGASLQMQWEIKWFKYVKKSMPIHFPQYNDKNQTPKEVFDESHKHLVKEGRKWLKETSDSCSVVAALIATVAFATSATVPGGLNQDNGQPTFERYTAFRIFAISSLVALCFSVTSLVMFLAILTSRYDVKDFRRNLPRKLLLGLSTLFVSIAAILVSFCAGHFFVLKDELRYVAFPVYAVTCLPVTFFAIAQFPLYLDLLWATFKKVPKRGSKDDN